MKKILITGAGGSPATNFVRSLKAMKEKTFLVGLDASEYYLHRSETDVSYLSPPYTHKHYFDFINYITKKHKLELIHVQNDSELEVISANREKLIIKTFLPAKETVALCMNKFDLQKKWEENGIKVPKSMMIRNFKDLKDAYDQYNGKVWIREISGAGGKGSLAPTNINQAKIWIDFKEGWGKFVAAELLSPDSITWMSIWKDGKLIVAQGRKRLYWELAKISPSGITGATGGGVTTSDRGLDSIAMKCIQVIDKRPNGIFSVDLTYDFSGVPNPTEINIGRFFTTHEFFTAAGLNMPEIFIKLAYNEPVKKMKKILNPLKDGLVWIRGMDFLPVLTTVSKIDKDKKKLEQVLAKFKK